MISRARPPAARSGRPGARQLGVARWRALYAARSAADAPHSPPGASPLTRARAQVLAAGQCAAAARGLQWRMMGVAALPFVLYLFIFKYYIFLRDYTGMSAVTQPNMDILPQLEMVRLRPGWPAREARALDVPALRWGRGQGEGGTVASTGASLRLRRVGVARPLAMTGARMHARAHAHARAAHTLVP